MKLSQEKLKTTQIFFSNNLIEKSNCYFCIEKKLHINKLINAILDFLPEGEPFYNGDDLTDLPTKFFVSELIREKIFELFGEEIPYHTTVL